jgi:hypothetical protein
MQRDASDLTPIEELQKKYPSVRFDSTLLKAPTIVDNREIESVG